MAIVLIGPPAAGKSRVGKRVAKLLELPFIDSDTVIVQRHGPIPAIFAEHGEAGFRAVEREVVAEAIAQRAVVSLGGGAVLDADTQRELAASRVVMLDVSADAVAARLDPGERPLSNDLASWSALVAARRPVYERLADLRIDTSRRPMTGVADQIADWIRNGEGLSE